MVDTLNILPALYSKLVKVGGYVLFADIWMPSIKTVLSFIRENRLDFCDTPYSNKHIIILKKILPENNTTWKHHKKFQTIGY